MDLAVVAGRNHAATAALAAEAGAVAMQPEDAVGHRDIDAVIIAVPASAQPDLAVAAFSAGKHVLCEKPVGASAEMARTVESAWRRAGTIGMVNFCYRLIPAIAEFRQQLDAGRCGGLSSIEAHWVLGSRIDPSLPFNWKADAAMGGGALRNVGCHVIDYLFHGKEVRVVSGWQQTLTRSRRDASGTTRDVTADDAMTAVLSVPGWCPVVLHVSLVSQPQIGHRLIARGSAGTLTAWNTSPVSPAGPFRCVFDAKNVEPGVVDPAAPPSDFVTLFTPVTARFAAAIEGRATPAPDIHDAVRAADIADAIVDAAGRH